MARRVFQFFASFSLILCGLSAASWIRSYGLNSVGVALFSHSRDAAGVHSETSVSATSHDGEWKFERTDTAAPDSPQLPVSVERSWRFGYFNIRSTELLGSMRLYGFNNGIHDIDEVLPTWPARLLTTSRSFDLPMYIPTTLTAILPAIVAVQWFRSRRRFAAGLCQTCGYDLRSTPDRCPECGKTPGGKVNEPIVDSNV